MNTPFVVDSTIPGLGASDLARLMGGTYVAAFNGLPAESAPKRPGLLTRVFRMLAGHR